MTMVEVITIIATGILCVLCVVCIVAVISNRSQARANSRAIKDIEKSISSFGDSIKLKTDQLIDHIERQQTDDLQEQRLELLEQEILRISRLEKEFSAAAADADVEAAADSAGPVSEPDGYMSPVSDADEIYSLEEIEELDDEIELDDLFRELAAMGEPEAEEPQQRQEIPPQFAPPRPDPTPVRPQPVPEQPQPEIQYEPPQPAPVQTRHHQGYNVGRSGKKYTAEELNLLIRE